MVMLRSTHGRDEKAKILWLGNLKEETARKI